MRRGRRWLAILGALACAGCRSHSYDETLPAEQPAEELVEKAAAERAAARQRAGLDDQYHSLLPLTTPLLQQPAETVAAFPWAAKVDASAIPDTMITGRLRQREFIARHAAVSVGEEANQPVLKLRFSNQPAGAVPGFSLDDDSVHLCWSTPFEPGTQGKNLDDPRLPTLDAWYVLEQADGVPLTQSAPFACHLQIDEVRGPTQAGGAPSLLGRLAICFGDDSKSWIAGAFAADGVR